MRIISFDKKKWVAGLWWQALEDPKRAVSDAKSLATTLSASEKYDRFVVRRMPALQAGFGAGRGKVIAASSLAAALANALPKSWIGRFIFDDGNAYVIAVSDGIILPDGDFYGTAEEADQRFIAFQDYGDWNEIIDTSTYAETLQFFQRTLRGAKVVPKLQSVKASVSSGRVFQTLVLLLIIGSAWFGWSRYQAAQEAEANRLRHERLLAAQLAMQNSAKPPSDSSWPSEPWTALPYPSAVVDRCFQQVNAQDLTVQNWDLQSLKCNASQVQLQYTRGEGASYLSRPSGTFFNPSAPNTTSSVIGFRESLKTRDDTSRVLVSAETSLAELYELARMAELTASARLLPEPELAEGQKPAPYLQYNWAYSGPSTFLFSSSFTQQLNNLYGLSITYLTWSPSDETVTIEGVLYAPR
jgi:hypothetical protein